jgi:hypothetical protein
MSGAPEIVTQWIINISGLASGQEIQQRQSSIHHGGKNDEKNAREHSRFT